ncbi:MAG: hypothetical protein ACKPKO_09560, partial [Candidatus Fonsibacter sp.]
TWNTSSDLYPWRNNYINVIKTSQQLANCWTDKIDSWSQANGQSTTGYSCANVQLLDQTRCKSVIPPFCDV